MFVKQTIWLALLLLLWPALAIAQYQPIPDEPSGLGCPQFGTITDKTQCSGYKVRSDINNRFNGQTEIDPQLGYSTTGPGIFYNVQAYGAVGNDSHPDSAAFNAAINDCAVHHGGIIRVPPTGSLYLLDAGINLTTASISGCSLEGTAGMYWPGPYNNVAANWAIFGSWIHCVDTTNPCITMAGNGGHVKGLNFWYTQPTPTTNTCVNGCTLTHNWTPTTYPYTIAVNGPQNFYSVSDINIINATHCIDLEGGAFANNNFWSHLEHLHLGCFVIGTKFNRFDNSVDMSDANYSLMWYPESTDVLGYTEGDVGSPGHKIDWDAYFLSTLHGEGINFFQSYAAIRATNATVTNVNPIGIQELQLSNVQFNLDCQGIILAATGASGTLFNSRMTNVSVATDYQTSTATQCAGAFPTFFDLRSDNVDFAVTNLHAYQVQQLFGIGGGAAGALHLTNVQVGDYSAWVAGGSAIVLSTGARLDPPLDYSTNSLTPSGSPLAGPRIVGGAPSIASGFGTTPAIAGNDSNGRITVGSGGASSGFLNFWNTYLTSPSCQANDETTGNIMRATASQTQLAITGTMVAADKITYQCKWYE